MQRCPRCGLINPENALRCDCGFRFDPDGGGLHAREHRASLGRHRRGMLGGLGIMSVPTALFIAALVVGWTSGLWGLAILWALGAAMFGRNLKVWMRLRAMEPIADLPAARARLRSGSAPGPGPGSDPGDAGVDDSQG